MKNLNESYEGEVNVDPGPEKLYDFEFKDANES